MRPLCGAFFAGAFFAEPDPGVNPSLGQPSDERALNGAATATAICRRSSPVETAQSPIVLPD